MLHQRFSILIGLAIFLASAPHISIATAQQPAAASLPSDAELDALLAARNWNALAAALPRRGPTTEFARKLNWLKTRMDNGGGFFLALEFAREFWENSSGLTDDQAKGPRVTAGLYSLYGFELIVIDGAKCEDRSAPDNRISQLLRRQAAALAFLKKQEPDVKAKTVELAIGLERKTAPLRTDDDLICRNGLEEMKASLERGTQKEVPNTTGHYGKTVAVTPPPDWTPKFTPPSVYRPMQDKARADMRESLLNLVR